MTDLFNKCIEVILDNEGGFQDNPKDKGNWVNGELRGTKFGIAAKYFPELDIKNLTIDQAKEIYYDRYWLKMRLEGLNDPENALQIFDMGVNAGPIRAVKIAQKIACVKEDGICGPITSDAINRSENFLLKYKQARKDYYISLTELAPGLKTFLNGWLKRVDKTKLS